MIIEQSSVHLSGNSFFRSQFQKTETLVAWKGGEESRKIAYRNPAETTISGTKPGPAATGPASLNAQGQAGPALMLPPHLALRTLNAAPPPSHVETAKDEDSLLSPEDLAMVEIVRTLYRLVTGKEVDVKVFDSAAMAGKDGNGKSGALLQMPFGQTGESASQEMVGWGIDYTLHEEYHETESVEFAANGIVRTADGREIRLDLVMKMSREYIEVNHLNIRAGDALIDPLVIQLSGTAPELSDMKIRFDLDIDGKQDLISILKPGSGYLVHDRNGDGTINDGSELFGPKSGDGFFDLAQHDVNGDAWIDEQDSIFESLKIWTFDAAGNQTLIGIKDSGIGAIHLGSAGTEMNLRGATDTIQGKLRKTGLFLYENGRAGTVHEIDLVV